MLKKIFTWIFREQFNNLDTIVIKTNALNQQLATEITKAQELQEKLKREYANTHNTRLVVQKDLERLNTVFGNVEVSLDHGYHDNWAVISVAGEKSDYIRFVDLRDRDIRDLQSFLRQFDRSKIDSPRNFEPFFHEIKREHQIKKRK